MERYKQPPGELLNQLLTLLGHRLDRYHARQLGSSQPPPPSSTPMPATSAPAPHTLETYLSSRVDLAVAPLRALLHDTDIRFIRGMLKEKLASDPNLTRLVERIRHRLQ